MCRWFAFATIILAFCQISLVQAVETQVRYFQTDYRYEYRIKLLDLALSKTTKEFGDYELVGVNNNLTHGRGSALLQQGKGLDIAFFATNREREQKFLPIRIPILQGILGYRVLLVHKDNQHDFSKIETLEQLRKRYVAGFGEHWADMAILHSNNIPVMGVTKYELLFAMLNAKRFDYFPRGINEAWVEIEKYKHQFESMVVAKNIALYYPYYVYFFVSKNNYELASRVKKGLEIALEDGSFKALFLEYNQGVVDLAILNKRRIFLLNNPFLPNEKITPELSWWLPDAGIGELLP